MEYRDDREAARLRIETLEAKIAERDASLRARETELAERERELERLRRAQGIVVKKPTPVAVYVFIGVGFAVLAAAVAAVLVIGVRVGPPAPPAPTPVVIENGPVAEGKTLAAPDAPKVPPAHAEGQAVSSEKETLAEQVDQANTKMHREVQACMRKELEKRPDASGFVNVVYEIEPDGHVSKVTLGGLMPNVPAWWSKDFESCVVSGYKKLTFRPFDGAKTSAKSGQFLSKNSVGGLGF